MKKFFYTTTALLATALPSFAQEAGNGYQVPQAVSDAIDDLTGAGTELAGAAAPAIGKIVIAFIGVALILWVGRFLWRKAQGRS